MKYVVTTLFLMVLILYYVKVFNTMLRILQLENYNYLKYLKYAIHKEKRLLYFFIVSVIFFPIYLISSSVAKQIFLIVFLICFGIVMLLSNNNLKPKITSRIIRIKAVFLCLSLVDILFYILSKNCSWSLLLMYILTITPYILTIISNYIVCVFEFILCKINEQKAKNKIDKNKDLVKIAITGSYGKTSVKKILYEILSQKYRVLKTPKSFNTPNGLAITINNNNVSNYDVFIMEMGAKKKGDIKHLCKLYKPEYGILTNIGKAHLETFKNMDNIISAKSELQNNLYGKRIMVFNVDNKEVEGCYKNYKGTKRAVSLSYGDYVASDVVLNENMSSFKIKATDFELKVKTGLTGIHNISNILLSVAMARELGLSKNEIRNAIETLEPIEARMQSSRLESGALVINNGYNSNPNTSIKSLEMLSLYKGKRKIVVTPGFVEMGKEQYVLNYEFGKNISRFANECIVVKQTNRKALMAGLGEKIKVKYVNNLSDINWDKFSENDVILIENDLPENYF